MPNPLASLRARLADLGEFGRRRSPLLRRVPPLHDLLEWAARIGYGARGFVYLSVGVLTLLAVELLSAIVISELIVRTRIAPGERLREDVAHGD